VGIFRWLARMLSEKARPPSYEPQPRRAPARPGPEAAGALEDMPADPIPGTTLPRTLAYTYRSPMTGRMEVKEVAFGERALTRHCGLKSRTLAYLAYGKPDAYRNVSIPRSSGGERLLHVPCPALRKAQKRILRRILDKVILHRACHGFRRGRSILTNAEPHLRKPVVLCLDIEDFFPSITFPRVFGLFRSLGFPRKQAALAARLTTWEGALPQGAPTSPALANIVCRRLDYRLTGLVEGRGGAYTRYADDLTLSGPLDLLNLLPLVRRIVAEEGFRLGDRKTRIMRAGARQKVCGVVVNEKPALPRAVRRRIRAMEHRASLPADARRAEPPRPEVLEGYRALRAMFERS